jgi:hypothetical protein
MSKYAPSSTFAPIEKKECLHVHLYNSGSRVSSNFSPTESSQKEHMRDATYEMRSSTRPGAPYMPWNHTSSGKRDARSVDTRTFTDIVGPTWWAMT